jgi:hypothetical protein
MGFDPKLLTLWTDAATTKNSLFISYYVNSISNVG